MLRTTTLSALTLLGASLLAPTAATAATAAAPTTCRGQAVTIDGSGASAVDGTEGDDVIVSDAATVVRALGGNDTICITGHTDPFVYAGPGNDVVDASAATAGTWTTLGEGDDTYVGSAAYDNVIAGADSDDDTGLDVIDTGQRGQLQDDVESGAPGQANPDVISGGWMELSWAGVAAINSRAEAGADSTFLMAYPNTVRNLTIDTTTGDLRAGRYYPLEISGFTTFSVRAYAALDTFTFIGSGRDENVAVWNTTRRTQVRIATGGGDDTMSAGDVARRSRFSGGDGTDRIEVGSRSSMVLDLQRERLTVGTGAKAVRTAANSFEDVVIASHHVTLTGTGGPNSFDVNACRATVHGLGGRDLIQAFANSADGARIPCAKPRRMRFFGDAGNDTLVGSKGPDVLVGGPGRDRADGGKGRDTCRAETRRRCEVRR